MDIQGPPATTSLDEISGSVLTSVRLVVALGILASLHLRFGLTHVNRPAVFNIVVAYTAVVIGLPPLSTTRFSSSAIARVLLGADLFLSGLVFHFTDGIRTPYFGLWYLALTHTALVLGLETGLLMAAAAGALIVASEQMLPGGREALFDLNLALGKLPFLFLITWTAGKLGQELRKQEAARRASERRTLTLEAEEKRFHREMEIARQVQEHLLPTSLPAIRGLDLAAFSVPAREVGGDTYEVLELPGGQLLLAIADVSGKGVPAALLAVLVQQALRQSAQADPAAVLASLNRLLLEDCPEGMFVTAACVVIAPWNGATVAALAGHPPPLWWDEHRRSFVPIPGGGPMLGVIPEWSGAVTRCQLLPGDALILYTDGVLDIKISPQERLGEERLQQTLARTATQDAREWLERLRHTLQDCPDWPDDVTAIVIRRRTDIEHVSG
jgi:serine phosphatase RsbU (regulator of sigma subunit)